MKYLSVIRQINFKLLSANSSNKLVVNRIINQQDWNIRNLATLVCSYSEKSCFCRVLVVEFLVL
jgi:hypothetical protein